MKIGYQLFSALPLCETREGLLKTIKEISEMGYDGVEFCSYNGISAQEMKAFLDECNIEGFNSHVQIERLESDAEGEFSYAKEAGIPCITVPWISPEHRNESGFTRVKELLADLLQYSEKYNIKLLYHNHEFEFEKDNGSGRYILEEMLDVDSSIGLELDTFWTYYANISPVGYMAEKKEKLEMIHIKDYESFTGGGIAGGNEMPTFCAIGTGKMDNEPILKMAEASNIPWAVVEQDNSQIDIMLSAKLSIDNLKKRQ